MIGIPPATEASKKNFPPCFCAAAKISGAGRGDGCVLFSPDAETERELLDGLRSRGFWATPIAIESGMRGEAEIDPRLREMAES